ncbi:hypothetical protein ACFQYP_15615 [Nonomuraea antimicrobica]
MPTPVSARAATAQSTALMTRRSCQVARSWPLRGSRTAPGSGAPAARPAEARRPRSTAAGRRTRPRSRRIFVVM